MLMAGGNLCDSAVDRLKSRFLHRSIQLPRESFDGVVEPFAEGVPPPFELRATEVHVSVNVTLHVGDAIPLFEERGSSTLSKVKLLKTLSHRISHLRSQRFVANRFPGTARLEGGCAEPEVARESARVEVSDERKNDHRQRSEKEKGEQESVFLSEPHRAKAPTSPAPK